MPPELDRAEVGECALHAVGCLIALQFVRVDVGKGDRRTGSRPETTGGDVQRKRLIKVPPRHCGMQLLPRHLAGARMQRRPVGRVGELQRALVVVLRRCRGRKRCGMVAGLNERLACSLFESRGVRRVDVSLERLEEV